MKWWKLKKRDADLERELRSDLELEEEEQRDSGASPEEARYAARRAFGNTTLIKEQTRETWGWAPFERLGQDLRYALRQLRRSPGFALLTVFTLALCIGSTTAIFSVFNATLLRPLPFADPDRLVILWSSIPHLGYSGPGSLTDPDFTQWQQQNQVFEQIAAFRWQTSNLTDNGIPERLLGATVTASLFPLLGVAPELGRIFSVGEQSPGRENVVLISHKLWARRFASNPEILGKTIRLDGNNFAVLGVMPPSFQFPNQPDFWTPMVLTSDRSNATDQIIARIKPNVTLARAAQDVTIIQHRASPPNRHDEINLSFVFLKDKMGANIRPTLTFPFGRRRTSSAHWLRQCRQSFSDEGDSPPARNLHTPCTRCRQNADYPSTAHRKHVACWFRRCSWSNPRGGDGECVGWPVTTRRPRAR